MIAKLYTLSCKFDPRAIQPFRLRKNTCIHQWPCTVSRHLTPIMILTLSSMDGLGRNLNRSVSYIKLPEWRNKRKFPTRARVAVGGAVDALSPERRRQVVPQLLLTGQRPPAPVGCWGGVPVKYHVVSALLRVGAPLQLGTGITAHIDKGDIC